MDSFSVETIHPFKEAPQSKKESRLQLMENLLNIMQTNPKYQHAFKMKILAQCIKSMKECRNDDNILEVMLDPAGISLDMQQKESIDCEFTKGDGIESIGV